MRVRFAIVCAFVAAFALAARARADEIQFTNGDKLTGKIVKLADGKLTVDSTVAGKVDVKWTDIATMSSDEPVTVVLDDGRSVTETLGPSEPGQVKAGGETIALSNTAKLNPEPVQWHGNAVVAARFDRGNTVGDNFDGTVGAVRRSEVDRITLGAGYSAAESMDSDGTGKHADKSKAFGAGQYDYFFEPQGYGYGNLRAEKDRFADLNLRLTTGLGLGYQWIETETTKFNTEAGLSYISEHLHDSSDNNYLAARIAWHLDWSFYPDLTFFQYTNWYPSLYHISKDQLVEAQTGLRYKLWGDFFGESKILWIWDTTPAQGKKQEDLSYIVGIGYGF
ncbi:MAG TPA: DUF481 domain-containing protein [Myxococcota bacterium]|nr:DUF481 domain-containing protein [Myxococcota bacterium]